MLFRSDADGRVARAGHHSHLPDRRNSGGRRGGAWDGERFTQLEPMVHPVVRQHPESGRAALDMSGVDPAAIDALVATIGDSLDALVVTAALSSSMANGEAVSWRRSPLALSCSEARSCSSLAWFVRVADRSPQPSIEGFHPSRLPHTLCSVKGGSGVEHNNFDIVEVPRRCDGCGRDADSSGMRASPAGPVVFGFAKIGRAHV